MIEAFKHFIQEKNLFNQNDKILLAVSGGIDSMVMLDLFQESEFDLAVAHCNFKLRGQESDGDEEFVRLLTEKNNLKAYFKSFETQQFAEKNKLSIQEAARELRYSWFIDLCEEKGFSKIAVAHHKDDQTETFFINLFRGAGLKGLKGIPLKRDKIIRPLLFASRNEIENYAKRKNLGFRSDSSNNSDKYLRNKIRHLLLPVVEELKPGFEQQFENSMQLLREDNQVLEELLAWKRKELIRDAGGALKINSASMEDLSAPMFYYLLSKYGFNRSVTDSIFQSLKSGETGKVFSSSGHRLLINRDQLILEPIQGKAGFIHHTIEENILEIVDPVHLKFNKFEKDENFHIKKEVKVASFDLEKLSFPLKLRKWVPGDRFSPFGMKGSKLVSDYLVDEKVDRFAKENIWVLLSGEEIIWIVGYRASNNFKITSKTKEVFEVMLF